MPQIREPECISNWCSPTEKVCSSRGNLVSYADWCYAEANRINQTPAPLSDKLRRAIVKERIVDGKKEVCVAYESGEK